LKPDRQPLMAKSAAFHVSPDTGAVLFDLDGTLADTDPLHARSWQLVTESTFGITFTWDDYHQACIVEGHSPAEFLTRFGIDASSKELQDAKTAIFRRLLQTELSLAPGVRPFLDCLARTTIPVAAVSGSSRGSVDAFLATLWPGSPPAVTVSREDTSRHKPHPEPYCFALTRLGRTSSDCVAIEDTARGVQSAHQAGLHTVLIEAGDTGKAAGADLIVPSLAELVASVDDHGGLVITKAKVPHR